MSPRRFNAPRRTNSASTANSTSPSSIASYRWLGGRGRGPPPELAVDEMGEPAEEQSDRRHRASDVAEREDRNLAPAREQHDRQHAADEAAVARHAALPQLYDLDRMSD